LSMKLPEEIRDIAAELTPLCKANNLASMGVAKVQESLKAALDKVEKRAAMVYVGSHEGWATAAHIDDTAGTFLEEFKPQIKEARLKRKAEERGKGWFSDWKEQGQEEEMGLLQLVPGPAISKLGQATRRGRFQETEVHPINYSSPPPAAAAAAVSPEKSHWLASIVEAPTTQTSAPGGGSSHQGLPTT